MSTSTGVLQAALWDFDGTLADTEPLWIDAEFDLVASLGGKWSHGHAEQLVGNSLLDSGAYILNVLGRHDLSPAWVVDQMLARVLVGLQTGEVAWRPGALDLLASLQASGIPCGLVSASYRCLLDAALARLPENSFQASVAGDEVVWGKPHPEPYEKACRMLGVEARNCVVFEDSATGARSANAAGALVVAVPNVVPVPSAPRRVHLSSLAELDANAVIDLMERADEFG
jgi:HAD superfamily hydrolase (TIGR01509 family)